MDIAQDIIDSIAKGKWNVYRKAYSLLDFEEKKRIYANLPVVNNRRVHKFNHAYSKKYLHKCLLHVFMDAKQKRLSVLEFGCGAGFYAKEALRDFPFISSWIGTDLDKEVLQACDVGDKRFFPVLLSENIYNKDLIMTGDIFIATHSLEHIDREENSLLLDKVAKGGTKYIIIECPYKDGTDRQGPTFHKKDPSLHVLDVGSDWFTEVLHKLGYLRTEYYCKEGRRPKRGKWVALFIKK